EVIASVLYNEMLGSVPNFNNGSVVAMIMLVPSIISIAILQYLERYNIRYNKISAIELPNSRGRDWVCGIISTALCLAVLSIFAVIFVVPFVNEWPYDLQFTWKNIQSVLQDTELSNVYVNSLMVAFLTAVFGTLVSYGSALVTARSQLSKRVKKVIEQIALITNTIPGMVLGLAFLFSFTGTSLQNTFLILIICNVVHYFATPYLMMKESLAKMNSSWETTAMLMGDSWLKTIIRVVTPNAVSTILGVFSYYFINAMVTISAVLFLAGARTMVITTKIKQLQYYNKYNEIFVMSLLLLLTNIVFKVALQWMAKRKEEKVHQESPERKHVDYAKAAKTASIRKTIGVVVSAICILCVAGFGMGGRNSDLVVIYSNADDEAITTMKETLDKNGYQGKYILQSFGTSELGGKLMAEGNKIEADFITMSTFYIESAQEQNQMFTDLTFEHHTLSEFPSYCTPITAQEGAIILNTKVMESQNLPVPTSLKDLTNPIYAVQINVFKEYQDFRSLLLREKN
ncbi:MAG TPA: ABC transporter permease subunit, partial [Candidatus Fimimorpha faecalis]|nr:ABC transporter permease subunit [Candidatus Fimimorpha faecalis]